MVDNEKLGNESSNITHTSVFFPCEFQPVQSHLNVTWLHMLRLLRMARTDHFGCLLMGRALYRHISFSPTTAEASEILD